MSGLPWYKCYPGRFNDGMFGLSPAERGAYVTVLNCIYIEGGPVKDDDGYWSHVLGIPKAGWLKLRGSLLAKGKLFQTANDDGILALMNRTAAEEITHQREYKSAQAERGSKGGAKSRRKPRSDKGLSKRLASGKQALSECLADPKPIEIERKIQTKTLLPIQEVSSESQDSAGGVVAFPLAGRCGQ